MCCIRLTSVAYIGSKQSSMATLYGHFDEKGVAVWPKGLRMWDKVVMCPRGVTFPPEIRHLKEPVIVAGVTFKGQPVGFDEYTGEVALQVVLDGDIGGRTPLEYLRMKAQREKANAADKD